MKAATLLKIDHLIEEVLGLDLVTINDIRSPEYNQTKCEGLDDAQRLAREIRVDIDRETAP